MKRIIIALAVVLTAASPLIAPAQGERPPALVNVSTATVQELAPVTLVPGTVASRYDARLAAEVEGRLVEVADVGTEVLKGDALAVIEDTLLQLRNDELEAEVSRAKARLSYLESEEKRFASLAESNLAAANQLELTRSDRDVARSELRVAESRLAQNRDQLDRTTIRAPFNGVVVERLMTPGERVSDGGNVVRLIDQSQLEVIARAPLEYFAYVDRGQSIQVRSGRTVSEATIRTKVSVGDLNTHQFEIRLDLAAGLYPVGQTLRVAIPVDHVRDVLAVHRDALVLRPEGVTVFVVGDDNHARQVSVETGIGAGDQIEVIGEVAAGDRVVVRGNERLQPGQSVSIAGG